MVLGLLLTIASRFFLLVDFPYTLEISMMIYGIGLSFISGAANAVLVGLKSSYATSTERLFALSTTYRSAGAILGGMGAYYLFKQNIHYPWLYSATAYFVSAAILFYYRKDYLFDVKEKVQLCYLRPLIKTLSRKSFFWASVFFSSSALAPFLVWQSFFKAFPYGVEWGYLMLQMGMLSSGKFARKVKFTEKHRIMVALVNIGVMLLMPIFSHSMWVLLTLLVTHVFCVGLMGIFFNANFHDNIEQDTRATSESIMSAFDATLSLPMFWLIGYLMDHDCSFLAFAVSATSGALALGFFIHSRKKRSD